MNWRGEEEGVGGVIGGKGVTSVLIEDIPDCEE